MKAIVRYARAYLDNPFDRVLVFAAGIVVWLALAISAMTWCGRAMGLPL